MFVATTNSTHPITRLLFSPDGSILATLQPHTGITLLDRVSGQVLHAIPIPRVAAYGSLCFCNNGERLAVTTDRGVFFVNVQTGELFKANWPIYARGADLAERNGQLVMTDYLGRSLHRASLTRGDSIEFGNYQGALNDSRVFGLSPCGRWGFYAHSSHRPRLFDLALYCDVAAVDHSFRLTRREPRPIRVTFAANSSRFAVCDSRDVAVYDTSAIPDNDNDITMLETDEEAEATPVAPPPQVVLRTQFQLERPEGVPPKDDWLPPVAFSPEGRALFVKRPRNRVQMWDVATGCQTGEWSWRMDGMICLAIAPDGLTAASGARFGRVVMWDLD